jgi:hypothetical protein
MALEDARSGSMVPLPYVSLFRGIEHQVGYSLMFESWAFHDCSKRLLQQDVGQKNFR